MENKQVKEMAVLMDKSQLWLKPYQIAKKITCIKHKRRRAEDAWATQSTRKIKRILLAMESGEFVDGQDLELDLWKSIQI